MPAVGTKPKPEDQRRNRNVPMLEWIDVQDVPYMGDIPNPGPLPARSKRWWEVIARMPHCVLWNEAEWTFAVETAHVHAQWVKEKRIASAAELRMRERLMGTTWDARRDLRIRYVPGGVAPDVEQPTALDEYRRMLSE